MDLLNTLSILLICIFLLICQWIRNKLNYWKKRGIETPPYSYVWGNMKSGIFQQESFADRAIKFYQEFKSKGLKHGGIYLMWSPMYVPVDPDVIKSILQVDFEHFVDRGIYINEKADPLTGHLFGLEGKKWKLLRQKLSPTFTSGKMRMMFETLVDCTKGLYKVMDKEVGQPVEIKEILGRFTTDVIGSCAFGIDCNSLENPDSEFRHKGKHLFHSDDILGNLRHFVIFLLPNLMHLFNMNVVPHDVSEFFLKMVESTVKYREENNIFRKDFMHLLIQLKNKGRLVDNEDLQVENFTEDENRITLEVLTAQVVIFFEAGFETSSTAMTFCLYELAKNKTIQDKVRAEIKKVLKKHDDKLTYDAAMDMQYLEQTINETLRIYPSVPHLERICTKEYKLPGSDLVIEKGVRVLIPVIGIQRDPEYFPDPLKFDPDRFSEENRSTRRPFTFLPFGDGPRVCIGTRFAMMQTKIGLVATLLNYEFSLSEKMKEPFQFYPKAFSPTTEGGMWLVYNKISTETK